MEKLSITRGLSEIKILEKRINKKIDEFTPIAVTSGKKPPVGFETIEQFKEQRKSEYQSILDLIKRRSGIKRKIVQSNAITKVTIAGIEMTIAEAIDYKNSVVGFKTKMSQQIVNHYNSYARQFEQKQIDVKSVIDRQLEAMYGRDKKVSQEEIKTITEPYMENHGPKFIDSISCEKENKNLVEEIDKFTLEVDHVLSESNATTFIEID